MKWVAARIPLTPSFDGSTESQLSEGTDFAVVVLLQNSDCYEDALSSVYRLLQGVQSLKQLNIKEH